MEPEQPQTVNFGSFTIFLLIKTTQNSYGIKNGDYYRYRRYCSRKVDKFRQTLHYKYGTRTKYIKKDISVDKKDDKRVLQILLFLAQKHWAFANQCKVSASMKKDHNTRARFMAIKKLRRAYQYSEKLLKICESQTDKVTALQAKAYSFYLFGLFLFEQENWQQCQKSLITARQILLQLIKNSDSISQKVYKDKIDQMDQSIKFCNFKLSKGKEISISQIIKMRMVGDPTLEAVIQSLTKDRLNDMTLDSGNQITFNKERYPIKDEKIIMQKSKIDTEMKNLQVVKKNAIEAIGDEQMYEEMLNFYSTIVLLIDQTIKLVDANKEGKQLTQGQKQIWKKVSLQFQQIKISLFLDRNNTIFRHSYYGQKGRKSTPQTLAKLLSSTINLFTQLVEYEKQKNETMESQNIQIMDAKIFYIRTVRLMLVGQVYFNNDKIKQAYGLWNECQRCIKIIANNEHTTEEPLIEMSKLSESVRVGKLKCILKNSEQHQTSKEEITKKVNEMKINEEKQNLSLYELIKLNEENKMDTTLSLQELSNIQIIDLPGKLQPIPTRPIFYDLYQSFVTYPSLDSKLKKTANKGGWWNKLFSK